MSFSPALTGYRIAMTLLGPVAPLWYASRGDKEDTSRVRERYGRYTQARPAGRLLWLHAASVGESGVAVALIEALAARDSELSFVLSTGTKTSAELVARRNPPRTTHIYAPLDRGDCVRRFFDHWRPDAGVLVESELWPNLILAAHARQLPMALVNARMSPKTLRRWRAWPKAAGALMRPFRFISAADQRTSQELSRVLGREAPPLGNLKLAIAAPRVDAGARAALAIEVGARPLWLAASTHQGEDEIVLAAHVLLRQSAPDALLILAPRHPDRGAAVAALADDAPRRSRFEPIGATPVYVADTLGELGLFYDLAPVALVAGSLLPELKGHNPIEPAKLGAAILTGPHVESFQDVFDALTSADGAEIVRDADELAAVVKALWADQSLRAKRTQAARAVVSDGEGAMSETVARILELLPAPARTGDARATA